MPKVVKIKNSLLCSFGCLLFCVHIKLNFDPKEETNMAVPGAE